MHFTNIPVFFITSGLRCEQLGVVTRPTAAGLIAAGMLSVSGVEDRALCRSALAPGPAR